MDLAIIGAGNVGGSLAAAATGAGHAVVVSASDPSSAGDASNGWAWQSAIRLVGPQTAVAS